MDTPLTEKQIVECQEKFNLTYHVHYAATCQSLAGFKEKDVLEVGGSLPRDFVINYLGVKSWTAIESPEYEDSLNEAGGITHKGTILKENKEYTKGFSEQPRSDYNFYLANIEDIPSEFSNRFDLIFSIATFEHIQKFPQALEKMYMTLKPSGILFTLFSPIWSAHDGHHLPKLTDKSGNKFSFAKSPIPPWGHLLMTPPQLYEHLCKHTDKDTAAIMVYYVYNASHINRFFTEDYYHFINQSSFQIEKLDPVFRTQIPAKTQAILEKRVPGYKYFANNGILVLLRKAA